ncbi:Hypothetical protein PHPALM_730 [Phytophthora palmivora]|uniref:Uncharacterized protein n=1 Tax=Phytophthora palmivora TaxID=4796 RepID=A0A2P4YU32_9STRA|nr:Hypothetical protein PHPALM_730 [Phytophthora palmivora]
MFSFSLILAVENALECINVDVAVQVLQSQKPVSAKVLGQFMSAAKAKLEEEEQTWSNLKNASVDFAKTLCELLLDADDTALVNAFFTNIFCRVEKPIALPPLIIPIVRKFDWSEISKALLDELDKLEDQRCMAMVLHIVDGLDAGPAQSSLLKLAVERAAKLPAKILCSSNTVGILWKWVLRSGDKELLDVVVNIFESMQMRLQLRGVNLHNCIHCFQSNGMVEEADPNAGCAI